MAVKRCRMAATAAVCFSPLHEGDASVALARAGDGHLVAVSVPFTRGTPLWQYRAVAYPYPRSVSVPFTRGTPLWHCRPRARQRDTRVSVPFTRGTPLWRHYTCPPRSSPESVSVPFTRGTPLWPDTISLATLTTRSFSPLHEGDASVAMPSGGDGGGAMRFQSPSRGGRLCGARYREVQIPAPVGFSPLHEGDASVAQELVKLARAAGKFQSPSRGGRLCGVVSGRCGDTLDTFQSPSRGGRLCG